MIIYNVTLNVEDDISDDWLSWMKKEHIPEVLETGHFSHHYIAKITSRQPDETGVTFAIQYHCKSQEDFNNYQNNHAQKLQEKHNNKYGGKFLAFRTILEKV